MDISDRRANAAAKSDNRRKRLTNTRQSDLSKMAELELPASKHGDDAEAVAREKAAAAAEKAAGQTRKSSRAKTPMRSSTMSQRDEEMEVETLEKETNVAAQETIPPTHSPQPTGSRPHKRGRNEEEAEAEEESTEGEAELVSWLREGFEMPTEIEGFYDLGVEIASVPLLQGFNLHSRDPHNSLIGAGMLERICDKAAIKEVVEQDTDLSLNFAGLQICSIASTLHGFRDKYKIAAHESEKMERSRKRATAEKEKYKTRCGEMERELALLQGEKLKTAEILKASEDKALKAESKAKEVSSEKLTLEEKVRALEADNLAMATKNDDLITEIAANKVKAETDAMDMYDKALLHVMRAAAASSKEIPAITPELIAKWGSEQIYSDFCRLGHSIVPYEDGELSALAAEDELLDKPVWDPPALIEKDVVSMWVDLIGEKGTALKEAKDAARAALHAAGTSTSGTQPSAP